MITLQSELDRLYLCNEPNPAASAETEFSFVDSAGRVRAMLLELARPADWKLLSTVWRGVQTDLELPAPGIAVNGVDGYQLWFSVAEPVPVEQSVSFLEALRLRYLSAVDPDRIVLSPSREGALPGSVNHSGPVPTERHGTGLWSAFIAPDLAAIFSDEPWLDVSPSAEAQAKILAQLECIPTARFCALLASLRPSIEAESGSPPAVPEAALTPKQFLFGVMNDTTIELHLRVEAAKALLPYI